MIRVNKTILTLTFCCGILPSAFSQTSDTQSGKKVNWGFYILNSAHLETVNGSDNNTFSKIGLGVEMNYNINSKVGINTRLSWRSWDRFGFDKRVLPLVVGPSFRFGDNGKIAFEVYAGAGTAAILGNDYASFFGAFDVGVGICTPVWTNKELFLRTAFAQGMSFNSPFNYLDFSVGIRL